MKSLDAQLIEHMMQPRNYGSIKDADSEGIGKNPENGEKVLIYLKVKEENDDKIVDDIKFQAIGCTTTVTAGSMLTDEAKGLGFGRVNELLDLTMELLEKVPPEEAACTEMVAIAMRAAMDTYEKRKDDIDYPTITYQIENSCTIKEEEK